MCFCSLLFWGPQKSNLFWHSEQLTTTTPPTAVRHARSTWSHGTVPAPSGSLLKETRVEATIGGLHLQVLHRLRRFEGRGSRREQKAPRLPVHGAKERNRRPETHAAKKRGQKTGVFSGAKEHGSPGSIWTSLGIPDHRVTRSLQRSAKMACQRRACQAHEAPCAYDATGKVETR